MGKEDTHSSLSLKMANHSQIRQNYHEECEALVNKQVNMELYASYVYTPMFTYFARDDLALPGFADFLSKTSAKEWHHGAILMKYQTMRGGRVVLQDITKATAKADFHLVNFVQENFLNYHTYYIKMIGDLVSKTKRVGDGLGIHIVDRDIARMAAHIVDKYLVRTVRNEHDA